MFVKHTVCRFQLIQPLNQFFALMEQAAREHQDSRNCLFRLKTQTKQHKVFLFWFLNVALKQLSIFDEAGIFT